MESSIGADILRISCTLTVGEKVLKVWGGREDGIQIAQSGGMKKVARGKKWQNLLTLREISISIGYAGVFSSASGKCGSGGEFARRFSFFWDWNVDGFRSFFRYFLFFLFFNGPKLTSLPRDNK